MSKAKFTEELFNHLMLWEGRLFENDPDDQPTKFGIIADDIRECMEGRPHLLGEVGDIIEFIKNLDSQTAPKIIEYLYFEKMKLNYLSDQALANKICSMAMVLGKRWATICAQRALKSLSLSHFELKEDGIMGSITIGKIDMYNQHEFLPPYRSECASRFRSIVKANPAKDKYLVGWLRRAYN
jgi:lysozyme family protein